MMLSTVTFLLATLPWLNPFSPGPTPAVMPFLFSWLCITLLAFFLVVAHLRGQAHTMVRVIAMAWLSAACISAVIGLLQYLGASAWAGVWLNHTDLGQAFGNLRQRNQFATLLSIGLAAVLWWAVRGDLSGPDHSPLPYRQYLLALAATLLGMGNAASSSRTGLLQLLLIAVLVWYWQRQMPRTSGSRMARKFPAVYPVLLSAILGYAVAIYALPHLAGLDPHTSGAVARLSDGNSVCASRLTLWSNVLHLIAQKPWLGWGWGELDYAHFITLYPGTRFCDILDNAHNLPLHLAVELGVPVALLACTLIAGLLWRAKPWRDTDPTRQMAWTVLAVIALHSLLEYPLWYGPFQMAALLSLWLLWHTRQHPELPPVYKIIKAIALVIPTTAAIFIIAFIGYAAWNYQLVSQIYLPPAERLSAYREDTLAKISKLAFFQDQMRFAKLTTMELNEQNAKEVHDLALTMLHFSPEAQVVELLLDSAKLMGKTDEMTFFAARYQAAFPQAYVLWAAKTATP